MLETPTMAGLSQQLGIPLARLNALVLVEGTGQFSWVGGKIPALYERHKAYEWIRDHEGLAAAERARRKIGHLVNPVAGGYGGYDQQYGKIALMIKQGYGECAHSSTSWGGMQIMGFNHKDCGFDSATAMAEYMHRLPQKEHQIEVFAKFITVYRGGQALRALQRGNHKEFARLYNGDKYYLKHYDKRLIAAEKQYS